MVDLEAPAIAEDTAAIAEVDTAATAAEIGTDRAEEEEEALAGIDTVIAVAGETATGLVVVASTIVAADTTTVVRPRAMTLDAAEGEVISVDHRPVPPAVPVST